MWKVWLYFKNPKNSKSVKARFLGCWLKLWKFIEWLQYGHFLRSMLYFNKKLTKTAFWVKGQERPFSKIPMKTGEKIHQHFCLIALSYYYHFQTQLYKWDDICKIISIAVDAMVIINTTNKLLIDLWYKLIIKYKREHLFFFKSFCLF